MIKKTLLFGFLAIVFVVPVGLLGLQSLAGSWSYPDLLPSVLTMDYWGRLVSRNNLLIPLLSSFLYSLGAVLLSLVLTLPAAASLARDRIPARDLWELLLLTPAVIPAVTTALGNHYWLSRLSLTDTPGLIVVMLCFYSYPYLLRSLTWGYRLLGPELGAAARNLGAGPVRVFLQIELPLLWPAIFSGSSIVFLAAFSDYFLVSLFGGGVVPSFATVIVPALASSQRSWASVLALVFLLFPLIVFAGLDLVLNKWQRRRSLT